MAIASTSDSLPTYVYKFILDPPVVNGVPIVQYIGTNNDTTKMLGYSFVVFD